MVSTSFVTLVFLVCLQTVLLSTVSNCAKTISMYWNTTNSIFRIDNTDHIIDVNKNNAAFEFDQVNIICPVYPPGTYDDDAEKYIIYNVSKEEYETCRITNPNPRIIAVCDKPNKTMYFTITFRPFTPQPGGLEFHAGKDYFFISTSSKDDLHRRIGGRCTTHNMKVVFKVCCGNDADGSSSSSARNNYFSINNCGCGSAGSKTTHLYGVKVPKTPACSEASKLSVLPTNDDVMSRRPTITVDYAVAVTSSTVSSSSSSSTVGGGVAQPPPSVLKGGDRFYPGGNIHHHHDHHPQQATIVPPTLSHVPPPMYPVHPHQPQQPQQPTLFNGPPSSTPPKTPTQKKKNKEYSDHPNEVVKNEELTYNSSSCLSRHPLMMLVALASLVLRIAVPRAVLLR